MNAKNIAGKRSALLSPKEATGVEYREGKVCFSASGKPGFYFIVLIKTTNDYQLCFLFPDQSHRTEWPEYEEIHQLVISPRRFELLLSALRFNRLVYERYPEIILKKEEYQQLLYEFIGIKNELAEEQLLWEIVLSRLRLVALAASRKMEQIMKDRQSYDIPPLLLQYLKLMDQHFTKYRELQFYTSRLQVTPHYLNALCKKYYRKSATDIIRGRITLEAKRRLALPDSSIKAVAYELGFGDMAHFSKFFKTQTHLSPREFREQKTVV